LLNSSLEDIATVCSEAHLLILGNITSTGKCDLKALVLDSVKFTIDLKKAKNDTKKFTKDDWKRF